MIYLQSKSTKDPFSKPLKKRLLLNFKIWN